MRALWAASTSLRRVGMTWTASCWEYCSAVRSTGTAIAGDPAAADAHPGGQLAVAVVFQGAQGGARDRPARRRAVARVRARPGRAARLARPAGLGARNWPARRGAAVLCSPITPRNPATVPATTSHGARFIGCFPYCALLSELAGRSERERLVVDGLVGDTQVPGGIDDGGDEPFRPADVHVALGQVGHQPGQRDLVDGRLARGSRPARGSFRGGASPVRGPRCRAPGPRAGWPGAGRPAHCPGAGPPAGTGARSPRSRPPRAGPGADAGRTG